MANLSLLFGADPLGLWNSHMAFLVQAEVPQFVRNCRRRARTKEQLVDCAMNLAPNLQVDIAEAMTRDELKAFIAEQEHEANRRES